MSKVSVYLWASLACSAAMVVLTARALIDGDEVARAALRHYQMLAAVSAGFLYVGRRK